MYLSLKRQAKVSRQLKSVNKDAKRNAVALRDQGFTQNEIREPEEYFNIKLDGILEEVRLYKMHQDANAEKERTLEHEHLANYEILMEKVIEENRKLQELTSSVVGVLQHHADEISDLRMELEQPVKRKPQ